jgi:hypothetical protein
VESPLDVHIIEGLQARFLAKYCFNLSMESSLCDPLVARLKRECDRRSHTLITIDKVRTAKETSRSTTGKSFVVGEEISIKIPGGNTRGPRQIHNSYQYCQLLEIMLNGYVFVGNFVHVGSGKLFASMQSAREYLEYVRRKACPLHGQPRLLNMVRSSDEDVRILWAEHMRAGKSFDEALELTTAVRAAHWLWTTKTDSDEVRTRYDQENEEEPLKRRRGNDWPAFPPSPHTPKGKGKGDKSNAGSPARKSFSNGTTVDITKKGRAICRLWNDGKCSSGTCKQDRLHICNFAKNNGDACGLTHRRCETHR